MSAFTLANWEPVSLSINTEAELAKQQALEGAREIAEITDATSQQAAVDALARCRRFKKRLEESRKQVKDPVIKLGKDIDAMAKKFAAEIEAEDERLDKMIQEHFRKEAEKAAAAQRMKDSIAAKKKAKEEEEARQAEEESRRLQEEAQKTDDPQKAKELAREAQEKAVQAEEAKERAENVSAAPVATPTRADGMAVRKVWKFELLDIHALYKARPELVKLEPRAALINGAINQGKEREIPGLKIWEEIDTTVRS